MNFCIFKLLNVFVIMNMFTSDETNKRLSDFSIIIKYMPFLQEHGFSEFGKGQLIGKMDLLKESFSDSTSNYLEQQAESQDTQCQIDYSPYHDGNEHVVKEFVTPAIDLLPRMENSKNKRRNFDVGEKNFAASKVPQRIDVSDDVNQGKRIRDSTENIKWNYKNEDESSWITRIKKLAEM
jgi:hypothetical protein